MKYTKGGTMKCQKCFNVQYVSNGYIVEYDNPNLLMEKIVIEEKEDHEKEAFKQLVKVMEKWIEKDGSWVREA